MDAEHSRLRRWQVLTVLLMVVGYTGCYLCRSNFSVTLNLIADDLVGQGYDAESARVALGWVASLGMGWYLCWVVSDGARRARGRRLPLRFRDSIHFAYVCNIVDGRARASACVFHAAVDAGQPQLHFSDVCSR